MFGPRHLARSHRAQAQAYDGTFNTPLLASRVRRPSSQQPQPAKMEPAGAKIGYTDWGVGRRGCGLDKAPIDNIKGQGDGDDTPAPREGGTRNAVTVSLEIALAMFRLLARKLGSGTPCMQQQLRSRSWR